MKVLRNELIDSEATMNQMRNAIYHLQRFMTLNGETQIIDKLRRMGANIARTYIKYWKPINLVDLNNIKGVMGTIYKKILNSNVQIEFITGEKKISVKDNDCALCKYKYEDINVAGCEIIMGMVAEFIKLINSKANGKSSFTLIPSEVQESKTFGHKSCIHVYQFEY